MGSSPTTLTARIVYLSLGKEMPHIQRVVLFYALMVLDRTCFTFTGFPREAHGAFLEPATSKNLRLLGLRRVQSGETF